ncbi:MAG: type VI secretion system baseplate subunit TssK [Phycisphaerales bacterium JB037]
MSTQIHWHEGLFLQPHHLQALQRAVGARFGFERQLSRAYPYGVIEAKVSSDELENMRVRFERRVVAMPSGVLVDVPNGADLPPLDIEEAFSPSSIVFARPA